MRRRAAVLFSTLLFLAGALALTSALLDWPPPRLVLRHGIPAFCSPTGRTRSVEGVEFVEIGPGCFRMGSMPMSMTEGLPGKLRELLGLTLGSPLGTSRERPAHWVEFRRPFWIARTEITNEQYERYDDVVERTPYSTEDDSPVVGVTRWEILHYCEWLSEKRGLPIRLPSEAEWECAARAGSRAEYSFGNDEKLLPQHDWTLTNSRTRARPVATRSPNAWGLYDFHGNVREQCEDAYHGTYDGAPTDGSAWTERGEAIRGNFKTPVRVLRGGGFLSLPAQCRSSSRAWVHPLARDGSFGFRPAFTLPGKGGD